MAVEGSEQNINNDSIVDPIARFLEEGLSDEVLAELDKMEQEYEYHIKSLHDIFSNDDTTVAELNSIKSKMQQQQMQITQLQEQLNKVVVEMNQQRKQQDIDQLSKIEVSTQVQSENIENGNVITENLEPLSDSVEEKRVEKEIRKSKRTHALSRNRRNVIAMSEEFDMEMRYPKRNSKQSNSSLRKEQRRLSHSKKSIKETNGKKPIGKKPYKCMVCKKSFSQKGNLTIHLLIHTGERPHNCTVCKKSFNQKSHLTTHLMRHTSEKSHKCLKKH